MLRPVNVVDPVEEFETYRPLMFGIAYRMLGSAAEAEDVVQETYLRYSRAARDDRVSQGTPQHDSYAIVPQPATERPSAARNIYRAVATGAVADRKRPV